MVKSAASGFTANPGGGGAVIDPLIEDLVREEAHFSNVTREALRDDQLVEYVLGRLSAIAKQIDPVDAIGVMRDRLHFPADKAGFA